MDHQKAHRGFYIASNIFIWQIDKKVSVSLLESSRGLLGSFENLLYE